MKNIEKVATVPKTVESANVESNNVNFEGAKLQKELQKMLNKTGKRKRKSIKILYPKRTP